MIVIRFALTVVLVALGALLGPLAPDPASSTPATTSSGGVMADESRIASVGTAYRARLLAIGVVLVIVGLLTRSHASLCSRRAPMTRSVPKMGQKQLQ